MPTSTTRRRGGSGSGGKTRLDRESIIAAGLELAAKASTSLSVRELGAHLGADPTAIYRHFRNKDQLMQALLDELTRRSVAAVTAGHDDWRNRLRQLAAATLDEYSQHPSIGVEATVLTTHGTGELDAIELMLESFTVAGLTGDDLVRHYALLASHVLSSAAGIARARGERREHGITDDEPSPWFDGPLLADPRRYPLITSINTRLLDLEDRELFMLGVDAVIQSAERTVEAHA
ncbi:TetR/AcrR family transcriptional regulator [Agromyces endophyticus]|uniref:TetR/AcrR family transcriptional regulator n=1 Tax=Agromyces sp. H17E-10 TaxID=2932244 RepID=UPI001FD44E2C|nr:helix-turn-helix domain-containing protein [Agromyces sp. H17E-10]UOQ90981.1 TetR/AcrR family transcriptional regulator [Agromyces sp. H17E-10]